MGLINKKTFIALALVATTYIVNAQTAVTYNNRCVNCIGFGYYYCTDNICRDQTTYAVLTDANKETCVKNDFSKCISSATTLDQVTINKEDIQVVYDKVTTIPAGRGVLVPVISDFEKNTFINITYENNFKSDASNNVIFLAYTHNEQHAPKKIFDMSYLGAVLLPKYEKPYYVFLGANSTQDIPIKIWKSSSTSLMAGLATIAVIFAQVLSF